MSLPAFRKIDHGRTYSAPYCPARYGAAIERPGPKVYRRVSDVAFGVLMACAVAGLAYLAFAKMLPGGGS